MKHAVSISLGSPTRDKKVFVTFKGETICIERIGTGGDAEKARKLFTELDGKVDALSVGGIDLYVRLDGRDYPVHSARILVKDVHQTPLVDGRIFKYVLERRVFELAEPVLGKLPHFKRAFMPFTVDRIGLAQAVSSVADEVYFGDLMFMLKIPIAIRGLKRFKQIAKAIMPIAGFLPLETLYPPGVKDEAPHPKHRKHWEAADLIAGDMHYIRKYSSENLQRKWVITNTTTEENVDFLKNRGVSIIITTTPRYEGRSFGINMMEAALTAYAGKGRPLSPEELDDLVDELDLRPEVIRLAETTYLL